MDYYGFQRQEQVPTIQEELEKALVDLFNVNITVCPAGRTDRGVHALGQVVHFDLPAEIGVPLQRWRKLLNKFLPADIRILAVRPVSADFHARHSACWRLYGYRFCRTGANNPFKSGAWFFGRSDWKVDNCRRVVNLLAGGVPTPVFSGRGGSSYEAARWPVQLELKEKDSEEMWLLAGAPSYRYRMVRCLGRAVGRVLNDNWQVADVKEILKQKNRTVQPAPAAGCYLLEIFYKNQEPEKYFDSGWQKITDFFAS